MICINCGSPRTQVTNSRSHKSTPKVWRRRSCAACHTLVTTYEQIDIADQLRIQERPFSVVHLTVKLTAYLPDSTFRADEAFALAQTVGESLLLDKSPTVSRSQLRIRIWEVLSRYNRKAGMKYALDYDLETI